VVGECALLQRTGRRGWLPFSSKAQLIRIEATRSGRFSPGFKEARQGTHRLFSGMASREGDVGGLLLVCDRTLGVAVALPPSAVPGARQVR
jgi:hypothetical protein